MADQANTTTLVVVAAAAVVVAVLWSRRASAAPGGGRPPSAPAGGTPPATPGTDYGSILTGAGNLFSGVAGLLDVFSSDESAAYTIPSATPSSSPDYTAESFVGQSCSQDYQCGFGERCAGGYCVPEMAALPPSDEFAWV